MNPEEIGITMKSGFTSNGYTGLKSDDQGNKAVSETGTMLRVINSICGSLAGTSRPVFLPALEIHLRRTDHLTTSFDSFDLRAKNELRVYGIPYLPSTA